MKITRHGLNGVIEIETPRHGDERGSVSETFNAESFRAAGLPVDFVQDNHSWSSRKGVLRGLHYQLPPRAQAKLVRVVRGAILDVVVDIRRSSPTFQEWVAVELSAQAGNQLFVPEGFAHGFLTLTDNAEVLYKITDFYAPEHERGIRFDDPAIGIEWPISPDQAILSTRDSAQPSLAEAELFE